MKKQSRRGEIDRLILGSTELEGYIRVVRNKEMFSKAVELAERAGKDVRVRRAFFEGSYHWRYDLAGFVCIW